MDTYIYRASLYCSDCAATIRSNLLRTTGRPPLDLEGDSEVWPQGPYADGGGEADCPQHCDSCNLFLQNPITREGTLYVQNACAANRQQISPVVAEWSDFYGIW